MRALCACNTSARRYGADWLLICAERGWATGSCNGRTSRICVPRTMISTWTGPHLLGSSAPINVRSGGTVVVVTRGARRAGTVVVVVVGSVVVAESAPGVGSGDDLNDNVAHNTAAVPRSAAIVRRIASYNSNRSRWIW